MHNVADALKHFGSKVGLPQIGIERGGVLEINVGGDVDIYFTGDPDGRLLQVSSVVGNLQDGGAALAQVLLTMNFNGGRTGGSAFALDPLTDEIVLTRQINVTRLTVDDLAAEIEEFVNRSRYWIDELPLLAPEGATDEAPAADDDTVIMRL